MRHRTRRRTEHSDELPAYPHRSHPLLSPRGRWLLGHTRLLLLDEPTRGVDVGARAELYQVVHDLAADGIHVTQLIVPGSIVAGHPRKDPAALAERVWGMHTDRAGFRHFADDLDA